MHLIEFLGLLPGHPQHLKGLYLEAADLYRKLLGEGAEDGEEIAIKLSECYEMTGKFAEAIEIPKKYFPGSSGLIRGRLAEAMGSVYIRMGNLEEAKIYLGEYLKIARKYSSKWDMALAKKERAILLYLNKMPAKALEEAKEALELAMETGDEELISHIYNIIGVLYDELSDYETALEYYRRSLQIAEKNR